MPEAGYIPIPRSLARAGVKDMLRISDGRMSGTAAGAVILHVSPEAAIGGPLAVLRTGDVIELDVEERRLEVLVDEGEMRDRLRVWGEGQSGGESSGEGQVDQGLNGNGKGTGTGKAKVKKERGYRGLYKRSVLQADKGADFDFLTASYE